MIDSAETDLPEPNSPTSASVSPLSIEKEIWSTASVALAALPEGDGEIAHLEKRLAHSKVFRGSSASRTASPMKTRSDSMIETTKKPVKPSHGACRFCLP